MASSPPPPLSASPLSPSQPSAPTPSSPASLSPALAPAPSFPPALPQGEREPDEGADHFENDSSSDEADVDVECEPCTDGDTDTAVDSNDAPDEWCIVCFERPPDTVLEPCGHANLCLGCLSRLIKRRCPTCRARAKKVRVIDENGESITRTVREVIAERKRAEMDVLSSTLQIIFLGPPAVGKRALVRKLLAKYPLDPHQTITDDLLFSDGTDFAANARMGGNDVRLSVLRRTSLVSRRMMLDDVRVLKPDVLVLCCSAHSPASLDELQAWDRVLRSAFARCRVWALLADDDEVGNFATNANGLHSRQSVHSTISAISPPELRPRGHYLCTSGNAFNIGFRSLAKDVVEIARVARDEQFAAELAAQEVQNIVAHQAAGTLSEQQHAASLVIANNGIPVPAFAHSSTSNLISSRAQTAESRPSDQHRSSFGIRGMRTSREAGASAAGNGASLFNGIVKWFSGANGGAS